MRNENGEMKKLYTEITKQDHIRKVRHTFFTVCKEYFSALNAKHSIPRGFTLVELITVIGIIGVIGAVVVSIVVITLRGSAKTDTIELARQGGGVALTQMVNTIRYAYSLESPTSCMPQTTVDEITVSSLSDLSETTLSCTTDSIASNGASLIDQNSLRVSSCSFTCSQITANSAPTITIAFTLEPVSSGNFFESMFSIPFESSVTMRNATKY